MVESFGLSLISMNLWIFLLLLAIGIVWILTYSLKPTREKLKQMLKMGLFLAVFDFVFETIGLQLSFWQAGNSLFLLGPAVPVEVFLIAITAGASMNLLFSKFSWNAALPSAFLIAAIGTYIEAMLVSAGNLVYTSGWTSFHAFIAYFIVFIIFQYINSKFFILSNNRKKPLKIR